MKRFIILVSALTLLLPLSMSAQVSMAAGVSLGLADGVGANIAVGVTDNMYVRAGYSMFPSFLFKEYPVDLPSWGNDPAKPKTSTALTGKIPSTGNILFDYHPGSGSFRVTAGVFFGSKDFAVVRNTKALPEEYHSAGVNYWVDGIKETSNLYRIISDDKGILSGAFKYAAVRPYLGVGFGTAVPSGRVGGTFDLGVEYTGGLDLRADAKNIQGEMEDLHLTSAGVLQTIYDIRGYSTPKSYDKYIDYVDKIRGLPILPVMRFTVFVKLF